MELLSFALSWDVLHLTEAVLRCSRFSRCAERGAGLRSVPIPGSVQSLEFLFLLASCVWLVLPNLEVLLSSEAVGFCSNPSILTALTGYHVFLIHV